MMSDDTRKSASDTPGRGPGRRFGKGNPGKPKGARNKATLAVQELLEGEELAVGRAVIEKAKEGDGMAMRLVLERVCPVRRGRPVRFALPPLDGAGDLPKALGAVLTAVADGDVTPDEAVALSQVVEARRRALETEELETRISALEQARARA